MTRCGYEIDELDLSVRVYNVLLRAGITTISDLKKLEDFELEKIKGLSGKGITEIKEKLKNFKDTSAIIPKELFEQIRWERNIAITQLEELGIGLGQKIDGVYLSKGEYNELLEYKWKYEDLCN